MNAANTRASQMTPTVYPWDSQVQDWPWDSTYYTRDKSSGQFIVLPRDSQVLAQVLAQTNFNGHLNVLQDQTPSYPWDDRVLARASSNGHLEILQSEQKKTNNLDLVGTSQMKQSFLLFCFFFGISQHGSLSPRDNKHNHQQTLPRGYRMPLSPPRKSSSPRVLNTV